VEEKEAFAEELKAPDVLSVVAATIPIESNMVAVKDLVYSAELKYLNN
tara:strand:+ start:149 stop:292 length:144 start_codon:yes stop_codon:yes gene_type:complete